MKDDFFKRYTERKINQGIERGRQSEAIDVAKRMLEAGTLSFEDISTYAVYPLVPLIAHANVLLLCLYPKPKAGKVFVLALNITATGVKASINIITK